MTDDARANLGKMLQILRGIHIHPLYLLIPIFLSLIAAVFEGAGMSLLIPILNGFLNKSFAFITEAPVIGPIISLLPESILLNDKLIFGVMLGGFMVIYTLRNIVRYLSIVTMAYFAERSLHHLRKVLFTRYLSFGKLYFDTSNVGHHSTLLLEFSRQSISPLMVVDKLINAVFSLIAYSIVLLLISWRLTLVALPLFVILHFAIKLVIVRIKGLSRKISKHGSELGKKSVEILSTIPLVKSYRTERKEQQRYSDISNKKAKLDFQVRSLQHLILPVQEIITMSVTVMVLLSSIYLFGREQIASAPALLVYFYIIMNASHKFGAVSGFRGIVANSSGPLEEVMEIFSDKGKFYVKSGNTEFSGFDKAIEFRDLSFGYSDDRKVLENVTFAMQKGQMTAIVGPTGAGKSTLINLLMRYYECPEDSVFVDDIDIRELSLDSYLKHVALVSQDTLLLHDSLKNNISYGLNDISDAEIEEVVERARLKELIGNLPQGLDTLIGDRGVKLSGGEKQRVSIARALLKGAEILILDEATSSLDSKTEHLIQEAIYEAVSGRTSIVIAHRLSTIQHADKIVVITDGRFVEEGKLDELLDKKGVFHELWEQQRF